MFLNVSKALNVRALVMREQASSQADWTLFGNILDLLQNHIDAYTHTNLLSANMSTRFTQFVPGLAAKPIGLASSRSKLLKAFTMIWALLGKKGSMHKQCVNFSFEQGLAAHFKIAWHSHDGKSPRGVGADVPPVKQKPIGIVD